MPADRALPWATGLMLASGAAGLGYQIVWTQQAALALGHEAAAVLAVITAFFAGLALGAGLLGPRIERSPQPWRWYAACELLIGLWAGVMVLGFGPACAALAGLADPAGSATAGGGALPWAWAFTLTFGLLLPATAAMGATLPALARAVARTPGAASQVGRLYACNTLGAVLGVLATALVLLPVFGLRSTAAVCAGLNLLCAGAAWRLGRWADLPPAPTATVAAAPTPAAAPRLMLLLGATGLLGIGYEVLVTRILSQVTEATVYTYAALLAVYLLGSGVGAALWARWRPLDRPIAIDPLLLGLCASLLLGAASLWAAEGVRDAVREVLGPSLSAALATEALLALLAFALPTLAMGALFSALSTAAQATALGFSRALAINTLGAAAAAPLFGVLLVPQFGAKAALLCVGLGYLLLLGATGWRRPAAWVLAGTLGSAAALAPALAFIDLPEGARVLRYDEGALAAVSVVEDAEGVARLRINNRQQEGSSHSRLADARQALLPLMLHPAPQRVLFLGLGTGNTAASAAQDPRLQVDAVELLPEVVAASDGFVQRWADAGTLARLHRQVGDARRQVRRPGPAYDVIVSDNFHPARSGSAALYTVEHFQAVRARLSAQGVFCQWLPLHQLDGPTLRSIVRAHLVAFPQATALLATNSLETPVLGLVGRADDRPLAPDLADLGERIARHRPEGQLAALGLGDVWAVLGSFVAGPQALTAWAGDAPINTDDHPVVAHLAPRITYAPDSRPRDRLLALLQAVRMDPAALLGGDGPPAAAQRLRAYWSARDQFLLAGRDVQAVADPVAMLAQVQGPLLAALRTSPDFRPAYDPLLQLALAQPPARQAAAQALLQELLRLQPQRPEAAAALDGLAAGATRSAQGSNALH